MADTILFELVSPEALLASEHVDMVVVPGEAGYFGVQRDHAPTMSALQPGLIEIHQKGQLDRRLFVAGGFAQVDGDCCTILADEAKPFDDLVKEGPELANQAQHLREDIADAADEQKRQHLTERLALIEAKQELLRLHGA